MTRPPIPADVRRAVLVEAGHRCAIPRCGQTELDVHHIIPWETCKKHEYQNLIALCPLCHRRAHQGEIDRESLRLYKNSLIADFAQNYKDEFSAEIIEIKRRISEIDTTFTGYDFRFDFPDFKEANERIVSKNLEAWGNEFLTQFREDQSARISMPDHARPTVPSKLRGDYKILRRDMRVISIKYTIYVYNSGAAHGGRANRVQNFLLRPFSPITINDLLLDGKRSIVAMSSIVRRRLLSNGNRDPNWVIGGTEPEAKNFEVFNLCDYGILLTFEEYQIDCYAAGEIELFLSYEEIKDVMRPSVYQAVIIDN